MAVLGLRFCVRAFSSCLRSTGSRRAGSAIVAHRPSRSAACGILPDQGSNPCPLHWQADSQPLRHQGSPSLVPFDLCAWGQPLTTNINNLSSASLEPTDPKENKGPKWHSLYIWLRARTFLGALFLFFFYSGVCVAFLTKVSVSMVLHGFPGRI